MHWFRCTNNTASVNLSDGLMTEADAKRWNTRAKMLDDLARDTGFVWSTGTWRDDDIGWLHLFDLVKCNLIIAFDLYLCSQFTQVLIEIVCEAVVVIKQE